MIPLYLRWYDTTRYAERLDLYMCSKPLHIIPSNINSLLGRGLLLLELGLALRNLLVQVGVVALGNGLGLGLLGLLGGGRGLLLGLRIQGLSLLSDVGLLGQGLGLLGLLGHDVLVAIQPQLVGHVEGQGDRLGALEVHGADVLVLLRDVLFHQGGGDGVGVGGDLVGGPPGVADADGRVDRRRQVDEGGADGLLDLGGELGGRARVGAVVLGLLDLLAVHLGLVPRLEIHGDGALGGVLVKRLAQDLGQAVDDARVAEEDVVLGVQFPLLLVLLELGLELADVDNSGDSLAPFLGKLFRSDEATRKSRSAGVDSMRKGVEAYFL